MKKTLLFLFVIILCNSITAQNTFKAIIQDGKTKELLIGATAAVAGTRNGAITNEYGFVEINNIANGKQTIQVSMLGYALNEQV